MKVPSLQLEAFYEVARVRHFTRAAENLHVTQSALSQRILNLESGLGVTLLVRDRAGLKLTDAGERLLRFCRDARSREDEMVAEIQGSKSAPLGWLRLAGFSSVMWSAAIPALAGTIETYPGLQLDFKVAEVSELEGLLRRGEADMILTAEKPQGKRLQVRSVGHEINVMVESARGCARPQVIFDHGPEDRWSRDFLKRSSKKISDWRREYMDDIHGVIAAASAGWGRAVLPRHLIAGRKDLRVLKEFRPWATPVLLVQHQDELQTKWRQEVQKRLGEKMRNFLNAGT